MTNRNNRVIYTGITNNIVKRVWNHRRGQGSVFTKKYRVSKLVWYEEYIEVLEAIKREKQIKAGSRKKKIELIEKMNIEWKDLWEEVKSG
jgi:putative endonuclease